MNKSIYVTFLYMKLIDFGFATTYGTTPYFSSMKRSYYIYLFKFIEVNALFYLFPFSNVMFN